ncbi:hypothetical protein [Gemmatimonas sp.]|uniref:hypothetical protein n=1 Tax=Gemmatimonas sp. TaxID=1962908 RepID=UPI003F6F809A
MDAIAIVGVIVGSLLVIVALAVFWRKQDFPAGGIACCLVGVVLIGLPQFKSVNLEVLGQKLGIEKLIMADKENRAEVDRLRKIIRDADSSRIDSTYRIRFPATLAPGSPKDARFSVQPLTRSIVVTERNSSHTYPPNHVRAFLPTGSANDSILFNSPTFVSGINQASYRVRSARCNGTLGILLTFDVTDPLHQEMGGWEIRTSLSQPGAKYGAVTAPAADCK